MNDKVLFVIPVHNEEKSLPGVIEDIRTDFKEADILVVNDCSDDNTVQVLQDNGVAYLDLPVNLGYSGAVQTGIKYAKRNNYDYVIQFDGDGQHIASEARKLYDCIISTGANIVIGSRFLEKTGYKHSFFRRIGSGLFAAIIRVITDTEITDPTSGLQILDRKTIAKYSQPGQYPEFPDANLIAKMIINGYKVKEVSCDMRARTDGISMHSGIIKPIKYMFKNMYSILLIAIGSLFKRDREDV